MPYIKQDLIEIKATYTTILNAVKDFYEKGIKSKYLNKVYIKNLIDRIDNYINQITETEYLSQIEIIYALRKLEKNLFTMLRLDSLFTQVSISDIINTLKDKNSTNFVFPL